jgi:hypothetical protein
MAELQHQLQSQAQEIQALKDQQGRDRARGDHEGKAHFRLMAIDCILTALGFELDKAAKRVGNAYLSAYQSYTGAIAKAKQIQAMQTQLFFSILTVASSGLLSWISGLCEASAAAESTIQMATAPSVAIAQKASLQELTRTVLKDTMAAGLGEVFSACGPVFYPPVSNDPVPRDPLGFQNDVGIRVDDLMKTADNYLANLDTALAALPPEAWDHYNDNAFQSALNQWLSAVKRFGGTAYLPSDDQMARDLARGLWAAWMPTLKRQIVQGGNTQDDGSGWLPGEKGGYLADVYSSVPSPIEQRFSVLGIPDDAGGGDAKALIAWASAFTVNAWAPSP